MNWDDVLEAASGDVRRLDYVIRYSSIPVFGVESVSAHMYWVSLYSLLIHRKMMPNDLNLVGPILTKAIIHDLPEAITGDVVRTFKYSSTELKNAIDNAEEKIVERFPEPISFLFSWYEKMFTLADNGHSKDYEYVEAVVKAADFLSLQQYMNREWLRGNREFEPFFERMINDLNQIGNKVSKSEDPRIQELSKLYFLMAEKAKEIKKYTT